MMFALLGLLHAQEPTNPLPALPTEATPELALDLPEPDAPEPVPAEPVLPAPVGAETTPADVVPHPTAPARPGPNSTTEAPDHGAPPNPGPAPSHAAAPNPEAEPNPGPAPGHAAPPTPTETTPGPTPAPAAPSPYPVPASDWGFFDFLDDPTPSRPDVIVIQDGSPAQPSVFERILPQVTARGWRGFLPLGVLAALAALLAAIFRRLGADLRSSGLLPAVLRNGEVALRMLVAFFLIGALGALVPASVAPALPVVVLAAAVAVGWSARDVLQDLVAGVFLGMEGQLRSGHWVRGGEYAGTVEAIGLRVTWLRDVYDRRIVVPNRVLLTQPLVADDNPWPRIQFTVSMPTTAPVQQIRAALEEAIVLSPWVAPVANTQVHPDALVQGHWHVAVRLLDSRYADRFQGLLRERVEEILET